MDVHSKLLMGGHVPSRRALLVLASTSRMITGYKISLLQEVSCAFGKILQVLLGVCRRVSLACLIGLHFGVCIWI